MSKVMLLEMVELRDTNPRRQYAWSLALITAQMAFPPWHTGPGLHRPGFGELEAHVWVWFTWVPCGTDSWQAAGAGHPQFRRCSETPRQVGCFQQEFLYTQYSAKVCLKVLWKIIWLLGPNGQACQGRAAAGAQGSLSLRRYAGYCTELWLVYSEWEIWLWVNPNLS